jgi:DNA-binding GntR family transcriptional regulator
LHSLACTEILQMLMRNPNTTKSYNYLRKRILSGEFPPGTFLSAQSLSKEIGVSRTPVREALRQLEYDELVTIVPKLGAVVRTLTQDQFQDLLGYREALEVYAVGKAAELRRPEEVQQLKAILESMKEEVNALIQTPQNGESMQRLMEHDIRFHRSVFAMARNDFIRERSERSYILQRMVTPSLTRQWLPQGDEAVKNNLMTVFEEHVTIYEGIRDGDIAKAQAGMSVHLGNFARKVSRYNPSLGEDYPIQSPEILI